MARVLAVAAALAIAWWDVTDALTPSALLIAAALAVAGLAVAVLARRPAPSAAEVPLRAADLRARALRSSLVRVRDPAAPGRPRPRAPSRGCTS